VKRLASGLLLAAATSLGCVEPAPQAPKVASSEAAATIERVLDGYIRGSTAECRALGLHDACDGRVADYSKAGIERRVAFLRDAEASLGAIDASSLDADRSLDLKLLRLALQQELFRLVDLELWKRRPQFYEELFALDAYLLRDYAPIDDRARALLRHVNASLTQVDHVTENLRGPMPRAFVETDIGIFEGYGTYLRGDVVVALKQVKDPALRDTATAAARKLADRADTLAKHLREVELPRADDSHVLGRERFKRLLAVQEALDVDLSQLEQSAEEDLRRNKAAYEALVAKGVTPKRPSPSELLGVARKMTKDARSFIVDKALVSIPEEGRFVVEETPPYMQWNSAFLNGPGPFDRPDLAAFYYITLPDPAWDAKKQEEYLMPLGTLLATSVHEVYPGHYLQSLWIRKAPTKAQQMLGSYSFIEGWAHYTEQLMIEEGFGSEDPERALGQLGDALLRNCRYVVSIGLHTKGMSLAEAERRFAEDCKQGRGDGAPASLPRDVRSRLLRLHPRQAADPGAARRGEAPPRRELRRATLPRRALVAREPAGPAHSRARPRRDRRSLARAAAAADRGETERRGAERHHAEAGVVILGRGRRALGRAAGLGRAGVALALGVGVARDLDVEVVDDRVGARLEVVGVDPLPVAEEGALGRLAGDLAAALELCLAVDVAVCLALDLAIGVGRRLAPTLAARLAARLAVGQLDLAARAALDVAARLTRRATLRLVRVARAAALTVREAAALAVGSAIELATFTVDVAPSLAVERALDVDVEVAATLTAEVQLRRALDLEREGLTGRVAVDVELHLALHIPAWVEEEVAARAEIGRLGLLGDRERGAEAQGGEEKAGGAHGGESPCRVQPHGKQDRHQQARAKASSRKRSRVASRSCSPPTQP
jgi:uncharacterized protein (DUF885 family)